MSSYPCYKIKQIEPLEEFSREQRERVLEQAGYNLFSVDSRYVSVDLLTDSGTGAMSAAQSSAMQLGDEAYAGSASYRELKSAVREIFGFEHFMPVHQGRAAESIIAKNLVRSESATLSNGHFDTTQANMQSAGAETLNLCVAQCAASGVFCGNMDLGKLQDALGKLDVSLVIVTVTNNAMAGHPVSLENLSAVAEQTRRAGVPLFLDSARIFENAYFIQKHESACQNLSIGEIVRKMCAEADGMWMSAKKNGIVNIGGLLCINDAALYEKCRASLALQEGFTHYGGMAGRDLAALAVGLREGMQPSYLHWHIECVVGHLASELKRIGVPVIEPFSGHAVFIDAAAMLPHIASDAFPGQALAIELFLEGGVRSCEIGSVMFSPDQQQASPRELLRLAVPRRVYAHEHIDWVVQCFERILGRVSSIRGCRITKQPKQLRHFFCEFALID